MPRINEPEAIAWSYAVAANASRSAALPVHSKQFRARQINHLQTEPAVARDPLPDRSWVEIPERARGRIIDDFETEKAPTIGRVKAELGVCGDADVVARNDAEHHGAGGGAFAVDDDLFATRPQRHIARPIGTDLAAVVVRYPDCRRSGPKPGQDDGNRKPKRDLKFRATYSCPQRAGPASQ